MKKNELIVSLVCHLTFDLDEVLDRHNETAERAICVQDIKRMRLIEPHRLAVQLSDGSNHVINLFNPFESPSLEEDAEPLALQMIASDDQVYGNGIIYDDDDVCISLDEPND